MLTATVSALRNARRIDMHIQIEPEEAKEDEMKQVVQRVTEKVLGAGEGKPLQVDAEESAVDFADRCGYTKFNYQYELDGRMVIVDIMDPARTDQFNTPLQ